MFRHLKVGQRPPLVAFGAVRSYVPATSSVGSRTCAPSTAASSAKFVDKRDARF